ncbi:PH domain-containing protein [Bacillus sp. CGMCC 1.60114]|uniref:PH domain-containing protein n=1 Tax=unclassified Bacillus (in: firmicutes) TaxID=185979 RepID=UPI00364203ED
MYFPSKKDLWLYPIYFGCIIACFVPLFIRRDYEALFFTIPFAILLIWSWFTTGYKINNELLIIQNGPIKKRIPIKDIKKITQTKNPLASSALSIHRLEIIYDSNFGMALVSPKDKQKFASLLESMNPQIEVEIRLNQ